MKYGGKKLLDINSYSKFKTEAQTKVSGSEIKLTNQELGDYATSTFSQLLKPTSSPILTLTNLSNSAYNLTIDPNTKQVDTPELFVYFHEKFKNNSKQDVEKKQDELDGGETEGENKANDAKDKGRYHGAGDEIDKDFSGSDTFGIGNLFSGVIGLMSSLINLDIADIRDDLYVTSYMMYMFSYATYEEEGIYRYLMDSVEGKEKRKELKLPLDPNEHRPPEYENYMGNADTEKTWLSTNDKDSYNKSLRNKMINKENNAAYAAEVEYILFGGENEDNVKAAYSNIYGIRYPLNLISGFSNFWSMGKDNLTAKAINYVAGFIQGTTGGIIPAPLVKVILIPILTIFETSKDLDRLEAGFPVEMYKKGDEQWWVKVPDESTANSMSSVGGLTSLFTGDAFKGPNQDKGIFYSDYLTTFVYLGLKSSCAEAMYQRMAEVIQGSMRKQTGKNDYSMKKAIIYFKLDSTIRVKPLMIALPYFDGYDNNMDTKTDWCTYKVSTVRGY